MELSGKDVVVVGLAQTGVAVAKFCAARGARVTVTDARAAEALADRIADLDGMAALELGGHQQQTFTSADLVVTSPGVPDLPQMRAARAAGVEVIAEIELAYRFLHPEATLIAITGTNGKSTTTALTGALCAASGRPTFIGGNLGTWPLIDAIAHPANGPGGLIVAEVAGFMLEMCTSFRPKVAACLNITEDHLDRYGTMAVYASMKTRIYNWQTETDFAIANANCELTLAGAKASRAKNLAFDSRGSVAQGAELSSDRSELILKLPGADTPERYPAADLALVGTHNLENAMAGYLAARLAGVAPAGIREGARAFRPQKHRMERIAELSGIDFYDDSKGTNVAAVAASLTGFPRPVVLIAGGVDKGGSYAPLFEALGEVGRGLVLIGDAAPLIRDAAERANARYPITDATDMDDAVAKAVAMAKNGDAVVLSPACASYDMFKSFSERGMAFREAAERIGARRLDR